MRPQRCTALLPIAALGIQSTSARVGRLAPRDAACRKTSVAILGGGMAGVTAAQALSNNSITDFVIIEYNDRLGGRATQADFGKQDDGSPYVVELGPNWVCIVAKHFRLPPWWWSPMGRRETNRPESDLGSGQSGRPGVSTENPIWTLAKKHKLKNTPSNYSSILTYDENGHTDYSRMLDEYDAAWAKASARAGRMLAENMQDETARAGLALAGWNPRHGDMKRQAVEWWRWDWDAALTPEESSLIFGAAGDNLTFHQFSDQNNLVVDPRGYGHIVQEESRTFLGADDRRLLLGTRVTNITYSDDGVTVHNADGSCVSAAYAICTFSLGVLQNAGADAVAFRPELPEWKRVAVQKFTMGTYTKVFLQFNETFWPADTQYFLYASPTRRGHFPVWQSLSADGFLPGSNIIFATAVEQASYRLEQQTDEQTKHEALEVLRQMFPGVTVPEPLAFMYPRWTSTPWSYGSYSNWPVGTTLEMHQNLRANTGRLWFAGEATSAQYFGFLHGAWFEGMEAGSRVAALLRGECADAHDAHDAPRCGDRPHYDPLHGTSPLEDYRAPNGWAASSFYASRPE
ncbi:Amine oxidase [Metarhizium album ARSEF 1941]|uniref:Amine oxidase n=1 Tax=Metarhizium album (strain ARSEF 1941) TaxID=1081103 RepID=A0A0B2WWU2_METAS|nr:Amine oxidase [Metarhizium album ARSEF 1941]KHN97325.1 Amine oxidase [Metarhizium album ARSEF 1941]